MNILIITTCLGYFVYIISYVNPSLLFARLGYSYIGVYIYIYINTHSYQLGWVYSYVVIWGGGQ